MNIATFKKFTLERIETGWMARYDEPDGSGNCGKMWAFTNWIDFIQFLETNFRQIPLDFREDSQNDKL